MRTRTIAAALAASLLAPVAASAAEGGNVLNPDISLILDGRYASFDADPEDYELPGFQLGGETGPGEEGLSLGEAELIVSANVDDLFRAYVTIGMHMEEGSTEVELEEAYIETMSLPHGLTVKAGRYFSHVGYLNIKHGHTFDFVEEPLPNAAFLGGNFGDVGLQLRWLPPTPLYTELGIELMRGDSFPGGGGGGSGAGATTAFFKFGGDVGIDHSWQAGVSMVNADPEHREGGHHGHEAEGGGAGEPEIAFTGDSDLRMVDFVWKWAPDGNYRQKNFVFAAEYMWRDEQGVLDAEIGGAEEVGLYRGEQDGWYMKAVYQWMPRWRVGLRYDRLSADNLVLGLSEETVIDEDDHDPSRWSAMVDFSYSEYSRLRLQYSKDDSGPISDDQIQLQYIVSLGPHGAHRF